MSKHWVAMVVAGLAATATFAADKPAEDWVPLFNGRDLAGWTPKIAKHPVGENYRNTFRVEDGMLKVDYSGYDRFDLQFGHLFTNIAYSSYVLRLEYRITGSALADAPPWAKLNSGVMVHAQSPLSMRVEQGFPVSMEFQFLAAGATAGKQTGNPVTPGTNLELDGKLRTEHIHEARSQLYPLDQWVRAEIEVHGGALVIQRINGREVFRYQRPQLDPADKDAAALLAAGQPLMLSYGHIALQAESQPIWFRHIEIKPLAEVAQ
jgi:hypothetical protein